MNEPFVPLNKSAVSGQSRPDFRASIVSEVEKLRPFQALGHGENKTGAASQCEPRVTLQREGERISAIRIQCGCGQIIELACQYLAPPETKG